MMPFQYRYVPYGTRFQAVTQRRAAAGEFPVEALAANELVVDVGGVCQGWQGETKPIFDHHFFRAEGQPPSAAAAVLHNAARVREFGRKLQESATTDGPPPTDVVWLVSHRQPDFDAFAAMYLARAILEGKVPADGWEALGIHPDGLLPPAAGGRPIDWFRPPLPTTPERRWPILLASYAACVDNCRRVECPRNRTLNSVLLAALVRRGREEFDRSGASELFDEIAERLQDVGARPNPRFDSVLEGSRRFAAELNLLDRQVPAYERDVKRARRSVVFLQEGATTFREWFAAAQATPLVDAAGEVDVRHLHPSYAGRAAQRFQQADGIYLRDPECLMFKDWAREDVDNSSMGRGFLFTAVAYTNGRRDARRNKTDYYFALDPEQAGNRHLYNVWAKLQAAEAAARREAGAAELPPRGGFEARAATADGGASGGFDDPWFDGQNYDATIVATPNGGSYLNGGVRDDLVDDEVTMIVERELEDAVYQSPPERKAYVVRAPASVGAPDAPPPVESTYHFGRVELRSDVDLAAGRLAEQIGERLYCELSPDLAAGIPSDFRERHFLRHGNWLAAWNRRGVFVAYEPSAAPQAEELGRLFDEVMLLVRDVRAYNDADGSANDAAALDRGEALVRRAARLRHALALPDYRVLQRFFATTGLDDLLATLHELRTASAERSQRQAVEKLQAEQAAHTKTAGEHLHVISHIQLKIEWLEVILIAVYISELLHVVMQTTHEHGVVIGMLVVAAAGVAAWGAWAFLRPHEHIKLSPWQYALAAVFVVALFALPEALHRFDAKFNTKAPLHGPEGHGSPAPQGTAAH